MSSEETFFKVKGWRKYQHYNNRKPPWIKLYNTLLDEKPDFALLEDGQKLLLIMVWLLASKMDNKIPRNERWLQMRLPLLTTKVVLEPLFEAGFLLDYVEPDASDEEEPAEDGVGASIVLADREQGACLRDQRSEIRVQRSDTTRELDQDLDEGEERGEDLDLSSGLLIENLGEPENTKEKGLAKVWAHYSDLHPRAKLGNSERRKIGARLVDGWSPEELISAIDAAHADPWHSGDNPKGQKYLGLVTILRDSSKVETLLANKGNGKGKAASAKERFLAKKRLTTMENANGSG